MFSKVYRKIRIETNTHARHFVTWRLSTLSVSTGHITLLQMLDYNTSMSVSLCECFVKEFESSDEVLMYADHNDSAADFTWLISQSHQAVRGTNEVFFFFRSGHDVSMWHIGGMLGKLKHLSTFTFFTKRIQSYPGNKCIKKTIDGLSSTKWQSLNQGSSSAVQRRNTAALPGCCVSFF